jgi:hypothetical protein
LLAGAAGLRSVGALGVAVDHMARLGWVLEVAASLAFCCARLPQLRTPPRWLRVLASESLFLYVFHILLVYGRPWGLVSWVGPRFDPAAAFAAAAGVIASSFAAALWFRKLRDLRRA